MGRNRPLALLPPSQMSPGSLIPQVPLAREARSATEYIRRKSILLSLAKIFGTKRVFPLKKLVRIELDMVLQ